VAVAAFKRLHDNPCMVLGNGFDINGAWLEKTLRHEYSFSIPSARYTDKADGNLAHRQ
jgi:hypothetical protein